MAKKYSSVRPKITSPLAETQCSLESAYLPEIVLTVSVASIFSATQKSVRQVVTAGVCGGRGALGDLNGSWWPNRKLGENWRTGMVAW